MVYLLADKSLEKLEWLQKLWARFIESKRDIDPEKIKSHSQGLYDYFENAVPRQLAFFCEIKKDDSNEFPPSTLHNIASIQQMFLNNHSQNIKDVFQGRQLCQFSFAIGSANERLK